MVDMLKAKPLADAAQSEVAAGAARWREKGVVPGVGALLVEGDPASAYYAGAKRKMAEKLGIRFELLAFNRGVTEEELLAEIRRLNEDGGVHGIMLELPLPKTVNPRRLAEAIDPLKDVDGIAPANVQACLTGEPGIYPATPQSCIRLLHGYGYSLQRADVVVVGRGETVGRPLVPMLLREQATVTVCHSRTKDLASHVRRADIAIAAAGVPNLITPEMTHPGLVLVDAGINEKADGGGITGDVAPEAAALAAAVSPVPGGVGTLTTVILFENVLRALELQELAGRLAK
ncbi:bifunctional 5,10-methylenetetrahydrofolate dehydrogenase/5,10-methenyltetrahydrofolate cyclohydrolase [Paenibacillus humicola]|uniref:bifunctional 5,10-methylenetetrahydrofolate dehydrogenase/5,10-methenyltetrahydrofolate cyclohydrolase n=1 Tax=Paenibacillus humicola TaxID=3110540 RepID=UPI00237BD632|nr:bifunctional 5,10-methylenetetrahydrofolate dehydrogenase/5,10-methenyltetrahydrofolate cyclohydrolase [Paenibacillus humicola]